MSVLFFHTVNVSGVHFSHNSELFSKFSKNCKFIITTDRKNVRIVCFQKEIIKLIASFHLILSLCLTIWTFLLRIVSLFLTVAIER